MSLIAWMPLNNTLDNLGPSNIQLNSGSFSSNTTGKVTPYALSGVTRIELTSDFVARITTTNVYSMSCWVKRIDTSVTWNGWVFSIGLGDGLTRGLWTSNTHTSTIEFAYSGGGYAMSTGGINVQDGNWHLILYVIDGTKVQLYVDGVKGGSATLGSVALQTCPEIIAFQTNRYSLNDFRVYDHALSEKEVKELAKGLCLHYSFNFEDLYMPIEYIQSSGSQYINTGVVPNQDYGIEIKFAASSYANDGTYIYGAGVASGNQAFELYPWSNQLEFNYGSSAPFLGSVPAGGTIITAYQKKTSYGFSINGGSSYSGTHPSQSFTAPYTLYLFALHRSSILPAPNTLKIYSCKIYNNDILIRDFIPVKRKYDNKIGLYDVVNGSFYTNSGSGDFTGPGVSSGTYAITNLPDSAGYKNGLLAGSFTTTNMTRYGNCCLCLNGSSTYINTQSNFRNLFSGQTTSFTVAFWIYNQESSSGTGRGIIFGNYYNSATNAFNIEVNGGSTSKALRFYWQGNPDYTASNCILDYSMWAHVVITYNGSTLSVYKNGVLVDSRSGALPSNSPSTSYPFRIGNDHRSGGQYLAAFLADFRLYATCLSASDVKDLYQTKATIDNVGNLYSGNFSEQTHDIVLPTSNNVVKVNELVENGNVLKLQSNYTRLEYIEFTGSQYIDTGVYFDSASKYPLKCEFRCSAKDSSGVNLPVGGCGNSSWSEPIMLNFCANKLEWGTGEYYPSGSYTPDAVYDYEFYSENNYQYWTQNYSVVARRTHAAVYNSNHLFLGRMNNQYFKGKIHYFNVYSGGTIVRRLIPAKRNSDNALGMYDLLNNVFYASSGSATLTAGPEIGKLSWIKANQIKEI